MGAILDALRSQNVPMRIKALDAFMESQATIPYRWGSNDALTLVRDWLRAAGRSNALTLTLDYTDEPEASDFVAKQGGLPGILSRDLGKPAVLDKHYMPQPGDVVIVKLAGKEFPGISLGQWCCVRSRWGIAIVDHSEVVTTWRL